jgi:hypothetical protein
MWMPETPQYFLSKDNSADAAKSLQWLRGKNHNVEHELQQLKVSDLNLKHGQFKFKFLLSGLHLKAQCFLFVGIPNPFTLEFLNSSLNSSPLLSPSMYSGYHLHHLV